jgi:tRNA(Arg) A34 adenosine deaminase TadA
MNLNHLQHAIRLALEAEKLGNVPVGAVITLDDRVIGAGGNAMLTPVYPAQRQVFDRSQYALRGLLACRERYYPAEALLAVEARFKAIHAKQREPKETLAVPVESFALVAV